jgi:hypothetical protein
VVTRREKTLVGWKERKEGAGCAMRREREKRTHVELMYSEIIEREGKDIDGEGWGKVFIYDRVKSRHFLH